jgi:hypothetical protein
MVTMKNYLLNEAAKLVDRGEKLGRPPTSAEKKEIEQLLEDAHNVGQHNKPQTAAEKAALSRRINEMRGNLDAEEGTFAGALQAAGWDLKSRPSVTIPAASVLGMKTVSGPSGPETWNQIGGGIVPIGQDTRSIFTSLPAQSVQGVSAVSDFVQTARSVTGTVKRALDATSTKADVNVTLVHGLNALSQFAVTLSSIPNALLEDIVSLREFLQQEGVFQVSKGLDEHVIDQIIAASPPSGATGTGLLEEVRHAVGAMRDVGANPTILALSTADAVSLDLAVTPSPSTGPYLFPTRDSGSASPLFGLQIVESPSMAVHDPLLIDPAMLGMLYVGETHFDANPFTEFAKNLTTLRVETTALYHVRNAQGAYSIGSGGVS